MKDVGFYKRNFFNTAIADVYRALDGRSNIGGYILTFCLIDHLTWLEFGHASDQKKFFCEWITKRLTPLYVFYSGNEEELYSVRCALVHTYGPSKEMTKKTFEGYELNAEFIGMHLQKVNNKILKLCLYSLLTDTIYAAHLFFGELLDCNRQDVLERLESQIKVFRINPPELFKQMHNALAVFDSDSEISLNDVKADYCKYILWK